MQISRRRDQEQRLQVVDGAREESGLLDPETRPMADMANDLSKNSRVYDRLSFRLYDCHCPRLDTEWLLSTLFDASLLSTSKAAGNGGSLFVSAIFRRHRAGRRR